MQIETIWNLVPLAELASGLENSFVDGPFGSNLKTTDYTDKGIRLIQLQNIGDGFWNDDNRKFTSERKYQELKRHSAFPGDVAIAKMADPVARACIIPPVSEKFLVVADCIKLTPDMNKCDPKFMVSVINHDLVRHQAELKSTGTTRLRINLTKLKTLKVPLPPLPEQQRIADILDTIDEAIQKTEALIEKLKALKQGLLHDLLTRGLDGNGKLRDPKAHPEQFKDSALGYLPISWEVVELGQLSEFITSGSRGWASYYSNQGALFLRIGNLTREHVNMKFNDLQYISPPSKGTEGQRTKVTEGDLLISITADLGIIGLIPTGLGEAYVNQHISLVRLDQKMTNPNWIANYLAFGASQRQFRRLNDQGAKAGMNLPSVEKLFVAKPHMKEQNRITAIIDAHEARIRTEQQYLAKLKLQKKGLMHDLLTGKVRVKADSQKEKKSS